MQVKTVDLALQLQICSNIRPKIRWKTGAIGFCLNKGFFKILGASSFLSPHYPNQELVWSHSLIGKVNIFKFHEFPIGMGHEIHLDLRNTACQHEARLMNNFDNTTHQISELANLKFLL